MKYFLYLIIAISLTACKTTTVSTKTSDPSKNTALSSFKNSDFIISFGSGNNQEKDNPFWNDILSHHPDVWVWGGDNIYCDTEDAVVLKKCYDTQNSKPNYQNFKKQTTIIGVWDDHDYGVNDGGKEYSIKEASQDLFLDFLEVPIDSKRRNRKGTYYTKDYKSKGNTIKFILLDTRYFRTALIKDPSPNRRYKPILNGKGSMLGEAQWNWLSQTLEHSKADYNIIISSIQFLSNKHGYEAWGNMPHEAKKLEDIIVKSKANRVVILSGDRHISEISKKEIGANSYPLIDFTSSGLTHAYTGFKEEENPYRFSKVIHQKSYGLVKFEFKTNTIVFEMWGEGRNLLESYYMMFK